MVQSISICGPVLPAAAGTRVQQGPVRGLHTAGPAPTQSLPNTVQPCTPFSPARPAALHLLQPCTSCSPAPPAARPLQNLSPTPHPALHPLQPCPSCSPNPISVLYVLQRHTSFSPTLQTDPSFRLTPPSALQLALKG